MRIYLYSVLRVTVFQTGDLRTPLRGHKFDIADLRKRKIQIFFHHHSSEVLYKHINSAILQAVEDKKLFLTTIAGLDLLNDSACANKLHNLPLEKSKNLW
jgi:hypothetical protein